MIQRALRALTSETRGMHSAAFILALSSLASAFLALFRDRALAHTFGAGVELDLYYAAFRVPDLIFVLVASLFSAYVLIPELSKRSEFEGRSYIDAIVAWFSLIMGFISVLAWVFTPALLSILFPELFSKHEHEFVALTRLLLLQPILLGFSNILAAVTQHMGRYFLYALTPIVYNIGILVGVLVLYPSFGMSGLGWGVVLGSFLHMGVQIPVVLRAGFFTQLHRLVPPRVIYATLLTSLPRTLALSVSQLVIFGLFVLAHRVTEGSLAVFSFAINLQAVPLAIIGASYSVAAFPQLSRMMAEGRQSEFVVQVGSAMRHILFWSMPALALLVVLRAHIVRATLGSGEFDWTDTRLTAGALAILGFSLAAQSISLLLSRAYYAAGRSYTPFVIQIISGSIALVTGYLLLIVFNERGPLDFVESLLRVNNVAGAGMLALPFAFVVGSIITVLGLFFFFERTFHGLRKEIKDSFWESITASGVTGAAAYAVLSVFGGITSATTLSLVLLHGLSAGIIGIGAGALTYVLLGSKELQEIKIAITERVMPSTKVQSGEESTSIV